MLLQKFNFNFLKWGEDGCYISNKKSIWCIKYDDTYVLSIKTKQKKKKEKTSLKKWTVLSMKTHIYIYIYLVCGQFTSSCIHAFVHSLIYNKRCTISISRAYSRRFRFRSMEMYAFDQSTIWFLFSFVFTD